MKRLAVLTSGGDAPGMNAAIRSVTRSALARGFEVFGVRHGYTGLIAGEFVAFGPREVGGILSLGGTTLGTTRCAELRTDAGQDKALRSLAQHGIGALVVIGGNGSQCGAHALSSKGLAVVGVASTIDNDLLGSDITIGATTAIDVALESVDRLRVTASSHGRGFLVEVMGRDCGYLAAMVGIAGGAEFICVPELPQEPEAVAARSTRPTSVARRTRWWWWPKAPRTTPTRWRSTSRPMNRGWASTCACASWAMCSAAAHPASATACWPPGWARRRWNTWTAASMACWSV